MTDVEERPVHAVFDCSPPGPRELDADGNEVPVDEVARLTVTPVTDEEWAAMKQAAADSIAARAAAEAEAEAEEQALRAAFAAHPDPIMQALAKRLGLA